MALTGYGAASICFFFALTYADASVVAVLLYAYPALVTIASWLFLGEKATWQRGLAVVITFVGCALVVGLLGGPVKVSVPGILLGLGAALGYTLFNLLSDRWLPGRSQLVMMGYTFGIAAMGVAVVSIVFAFVQAAARGGLARRSGLPSRSLRCRRQRGSRAPGRCLAAIVIVPTFIAVVLYLQGIRGLGPSQAAVISTLEPLFTIVLARVFLDEQLVAVQWLGAILVLAGVVFAETSARRIEQPAAF